MKNRYPGTCTGCGNRVAAGAGTAVKVGGRWTVQHNDCIADSPNDQGSRSYKAMYGRCEDAPCCGCCGGSAGYDY